MKTAEKLKIGKNLTRYETSDLQALVEAILASAPDLPRRALANNLNPAEMLIDVGYWQGDFAETRRWWMQHHAAPVSHGPWFTQDVRYSNTDRLLILRAGRAVQALGGLTALARTGADTLPDEARDQIATFLAHRLGFRETVITAHGHGRDCIGTLFERLSRLPRIQDVHIRINTHAADKKPPPDSAEQLRNLRKTFLTGGAATRRQEAEAYARNYVRIYDESYRQTEAQRTRLMRRGDDPKPYLSTVALLEELLALAREGNL